jgi:hypothetical protein
MKISVFGFELFRSLPPSARTLLNWLHLRARDVRVITGFPSAPNWKIWNSYRKLICAM